MANLTLAPRVDWFTYIYTDTTLALKRYNAMVAKDNDPYRQQGPHIVAREIPWQAWQAIADRITHVMVERAVWPGSLNYTTLHACLVDAMHRAHDAGMPLGA